MTCSVNISPQLLKVKLPAPANNSPVFSNAEGHSVLVLYCLIMYFADISIRTATYKSLKRWNTIEASREFSITCMKQEQGRIRMPKIAVI